MPNLLHMDTGFLTRFSNPLPCSAQLSRWPGLCLSGHFCDKTGVRDQRAHRHDLSNPRQRGRCHLSLQVQVQLPACHTPLAFGAGGRKTLPSADCSGLGIAQPPPSRLLLQSQTEKDPVPSLSPCLSLPATDKQKMLQERVPILPTHLWTTFTHLFEAIKFW